MAAVVNGVPVAIPPPEGYEVDFDNPQRNSVTAAYWLFGVGNFLALLFYASASLRSTGDSEDSSVRRCLLGYRICVFGGPPNPHYP
ncbi:hypothetical protein NW754_009270 [Fusarium falciforme]|nr:hypothetical protein NW754_009270 [Fusarium falciforme]